MTAAAVRAVLLRHGVDPTAAPEVLTEAIEARGWSVRIERHDGGERTRRYRALASRPAPDTHPSLGILLHLSAAGPTTQIALVLALGKILAREERPDLRATLPSRRGRP